MEGRQGVALWSALAVCAAVLASLLCGLQGSVEAVASPSLERPTVVVDAGHGGFDGGAVAPDGTQEKDINLAVAEDLRLMLVLCGYEVIPTRVGDEALSSDGATVRENKTRDMAARLALFEEADFNISIHQNMFGVARYHGAQVFYSENNPLSKRLAGMVREELVSRLQPANERSVKAGGKEIYLLYKTTRPTVLVECGFLSNPDELSRLKDADYQRRLSFAVLCGILRYTKEGAP